MTLKNGRIRALRRRSGLKQKPFWARIGISQSGGSRYENRGRVPKPVRLLLEIAYGAHPSRTLAKLRPEV